MDQLLYSRIEQISKHMTTLMVSAITKASKHCTNCGHFDMQREVCKLTVPPSRPPATVIAEGCPAHDPQIIPF